MNNDNNNGYYGADGEFYPNSSPASEKSTSYFKGDDGELYPKRPNISYTTQSFNAPAEQNDYPAQHENTVMTDVPSGASVGAVGYTGPTKYCKFCGQKIPEQAVICTHCGCQVENFVQPNATQPVIVNNNISNNNTNSNYNAPMGRKKNKWVAFLLCFFGGYLGLHRFYEGKILSALLYMFSFGLFGIGILVDLIIILCRPNPYYLN